jgi:hypothetical protein
MPEELIVGANINLLTHAVRSTKSADSIPYNSSEQCSPNTVTLCKGIQVFLFVFHYTFITAKNVAINVADMSFKI